MFIHQFSQSSIVFRTKAHGGTDGQTEQHLPTLSSYSELKTQRKSYKNLFLTAHI